MASWILAVLFLSSLTEFVTGEPGVTVTCDEYEMAVSFDKGRFPSVNASNMHLSSSGCKATDASSHISIRTSLNDCGTSFVETGDNIIFLNVVYDDADPTGKGSAITREHDFEFPFNCSYSKTKFLSLHFVPEGRLEIPGVEGFGEFNFTFDIYRTSSYVQRYTTDQFPVQVPLNEDIHLQYTVESTADLVVMAKNCKATKSSDYYSSPQYTIIQDGCPTDTTLDHKYDRSRSMQRFKMKAFRFFNDYSSVYLHCELLACHRSSSNSRCYRGCVGQPSFKRKRRQLEEDTVGPYLIKRGPILILEETAEKKSGKPDTSKQSAVVIGSATAAGGIGLVAVIALAVLFVKYRTARLMLNRNKVGDLYTTQDEQMSRRNAYIQDDDTIERSTESENA